MKITDILKLYAKGILFTFGALIAGFIVFVIYKSAIQPRLTAAGACVGKDHCLYSLVNGRDSVRVLGYSADGQTLITRGGDGTLLHSSDDGDKLARVKPDFESKSFKTIIAGDGSLIATLSTRENGVEFFNPAGESQDNWYWNEDRTIIDFEFLPLVDGFALSGDDGITMWRMTDGTLFTTLPGAEGAGLMAGSADGAWLTAYKKAEDAIYVWPLERIGDSIIIKEAGITDSVILGDDSLQISADGSRVAAYGKAAANVWDTSDGSLLFSISLSEVDIDVRAMSFSADGSHLAVGYSDGIAEVWSLDDDLAVKEFEHKQTISGLALSPDGAQLAVGHSDDAIITQITAQERALARIRARNRAQTTYNGRKNLPANGDQFLTPGNVYIDTIPGYGLVWDVSADS